MIITHSIGWRNPIGLLTKQTPGGLKQSVNNRWNGERNTFIFFLPFTIISYGAK